MDSSKVKKRSRKVHHTRKLSSTLSTSYKTPAATKHRMASLSKNNRFLATGLQEVRCELSRYKKLLEQAIQYISKTKLAHGKLLEMYSVLKTFVNNFDESLLLLKFDDSKWVDMHAPMRLCKKFQKRMNPIVETDVQVFEEVSNKINSIIEADKEAFQEVSIEMNPFIEAVYGNFEISIDQDTDFHHEKVKQIDCSSTEVLHCVPDSSSRNYQEITEKMLDEVESSNYPKINTSVQNCIHSISSTQTDVAFHYPVLPISQYDDFKGRIPTGLTGPEIIENELSNPKNVSPLNDDQSPKTPGVSFLLPTNNLITPALKSDFSQENSLIPNENGTDILKDASFLCSASQNVQLSKIPRLQDFSIKVKKLNLTEEFINKNAPSKRKLPKKGSEESNSNFSRRKTFVIKDKMISESSTTVYKNVPNIEVLCENEPDIREKSDLLLRRKTFVVKASDITEDALISDNNRRKMFVMEHNDPPISDQCKDVFANPELASKVPENNNSINKNENLKIKTVQLNMSDLKVNKHASFKNGSITAGNSEKLFHNLDVSTVETNEILKTPPVLILETESENALIDSELPKDEKGVKDSVELQSKIDYDHIKKLKAIEFEVIDTEVAPSNDLQKVVQNDIHIMDTEVAFSNDLQKVVQNDIHIMDTKVTSSNDLQNIIQNDIEIIDVIDNKPKIHKNYKLYFESSESECESIPVEDIDFVVESTIKTTPIRRHISNNKRKKFTFDGNKKKSVTRKKSVCKNSEIDSNCSKEKADIHQFGVYHVDPKINTENQNKLNDETLNFMLDEQINKDNIDANVQSDICKLQKNFKKCTKKLKKKNACIGSTHSNNQIKKSKMCLKDPLFTTDENFAIQINENKKKSCEIRNVASQNYEIIDSISNIDNKKKNRKIRTGKLNTTKGIIIDDIISVSKKSKKTNQKKGKGPIISSEEEIISKFTEDGINNLTENKKLKNKKHTNKVQRKTELDLPCKRTGENTFLVQAEIHPPPSSLKMIEHKYLNKENKELDISNFQVSVVLNDILKSKNFDLLNIQSEKDLLPSKILPVKIPFSDNSQNISSVLEKNIQGISHDDVSVVSDSVETKKVKRCKEVKNYREPSLTKKMRR